MKSVKIKTRDPQPTEFTKDQIIINNETGRLFYKSQKGLHEIVSTFTTPLETSLSTGIDLVELGVISLESLEPLTLTDQSNPVPTNTQVPIAILPTDPVRLAISLPSSTKLALNIVP